MDVLKKLVKRNKSELIPKQNKLIPKQNDIIKINNYHYDMSNKVDRTNLICMLYLQRRTN